MAAADKTRLDIRDFIIFNEKLKFDETRVKHRNKWSILTGNTLPFERNEDSRTRGQNYVNLSEHILTFSEKSLLNKGAKFIISNNKICNLEVATDTELMLYMNHLEDKTIPDIVNTEINKNQNNTMNITAEERTALYNLRKNLDIIVIKADKGNKLVVLNKTEYTNKLESIIYGDNYVKLRQNPANKIDASLRKLIMKIPKKTKQEHKLFDRLVTHYNRDPSIFGNPKIHKDDIPLRPIISSYGTVLSNAARYLTPILEKIYLEMEGTERGVKNVMEAKQILTGHHYSEDSFLLFSLDVINMFGSIDPTTAFDLIQDVAKSCRNFKALTDLPLNVFLGILKLILTNSYFLYNETYYAQTKGLPMGSPTSPAIAKIYMKDLETKWAKVHHFDVILCLSRYMDDYIGKWMGQPEQLQHLVTELNTCDENVQVTLEIEQGGSINFLDATLIRCDNSIKFKMYTKEIAAPITLPRDAYHDERVKKALIVGETIRTHRVSDYLQDDLHKLKNKLRHNNYTDKEIGAGMRNALHREANRTDDNKATNVKQEDPSTSDRKPTLVTKYIGKTTEQLKKRLKPLNIQVTSKKQVNLEGLFASNYKYKTENNKGIIYKIYCSCGETYIGESGFDYHKREYDHKRDIRTCTMSNALTAHCRENNHTIDWEKSTLLDMEQNQLRRKIKEALLIQNQEPKINVNSGMKIRGHWTL